MHIATLAVTAMTAAAAIAAFAVAWVHLSTIQKSSQLAASQAVIDTYYRARDGVVSTEHQNMLRTLEVIKYKIELDKLTPEGSVARSLANEKLLEEEKYRNLLRHQALTDYATLVRHLCQQDRGGNLGTSAGSFLRVVIAVDAKEMPEPHDDYGPKVKQAIREMKKACDRLSAQA